MCKNVPETVQWIKKRSNFVKKWAKFPTKAQKCSIVHFIREIWCSNREIGRFDIKLGDSRENRDSWQECEYVLKKMGLTHAHFQYNSMKLVNVVKVRFTMTYSSRKLNNNKVITTACNFWRQIACSFQVYGRTNHFCTNSTRKTLFWISRFFSPDQHWRHKLFFPTIFPTALRR